jgi:hypothetical protein
VLTHHSRPDRHVITLVVRFDPQAVQVSCIRVEVFTRVPVIKILVSGEFERQYRERAYVWFDETKLLVGSDRMIDKFREKVTTF